MLGIVSMALATAAWPAQAEPALPHDDRAEAWPVEWRSSLVTPSTSTPVARIANAEADTSLATVEPREPEACAVLGASVWYRVDHTGHGRLSVWTSGSDFDTVVAVYEAGAGTPIACNDDDPASTPRASRVHVPVRPGIAYDVQVGGKDGARGLLKLQLEVTGTMANDARAEAMRVGFGTDLEQSGETATVEPGEPQPCGPLASSVWYTLTPSRSGLLRFRGAVDGTGVNTLAAVAVYPRDSDGPLGCAVSPQTGSIASLRVLVEAGQAYDVQLGARGDPTAAIVASSFRIQVDEPILPANDHRADASALRAGETVTQFTNGATLEPGEPQPCAPLGASVWFTLTAPADGTMTLRTFLSGGSVTFDTVVAVYREGATHAEACNDDDVATGARSSRLAFPVVAGARYDLQVAGRSGAAGEVSVRVEPPIAPATNDARASALPVWQGTGGSWLVKNATVEEGEASCRAITSSVWFRFTGNATGTLTVNASITPYRAAALAIYPSGSWTPLACAASEFVTWATPMRPTASVTAGSTYDVQVGLVDMHTEDIRVLLRVHGPPPNDDRASAALVSAGIGEVRTIDLVDATIEVGESTCSAAQPGSSVWYRVEPLRRGRLTVEAGRIEGRSPFDATLAVYEAGASSWLDCSDAPGDVEARVAAMVEPGSAYLVQVASVASPDGALALRIGGAPDHDDRGGARSVGPGGLVEAWNRDATLEAGEPRPCGPVTGTVWYRLDPDMNGTITLDTSGSGEGRMDTILAVYPAGSIVPIACDDDSGDGLQSRITLRVEDANAYDVQVGGHDGDAGDIRVSLTSMIRNDDRTQPQPVAAPARVTATTANATTEPGEAPHCGLIGGTLWYSLVATSTGSVTIESFNSTFDTVLAVRHAGEVVACSDDARGTNRSFVRLDVAAGEEYLIQVGGHGGLRGTIVLQIGPIEPRHVMNDARADAVPISEGEVTIRSTRGAGVEPGEPTPCGMGATTWYRFTAPSSGLLTLETRSSTFDTVLAVYESPSGRRLACNDDADAERYSHVWVPVTQGKVYEVQVGGFTGDSGLAVLRVSLIHPCPGPVNDCAGRAIEIPRVPHSVTIPSEGTTREVGEPSSCEATRGTMWFRWRPTLSGPVLVDTIGSNAVTSLGVFEGTTFATMDEVVCDEGPGGSFRKAAFAAKAGTTYYVQVGVSTLGGGRVVLNVDAPGGVGPD